MNFLWYMLIFIVASLFIHKIVDFIINKIKALFNSSQLSKNKKSSTKSSQNLNKDSLNQSFKSQKSRTSSQTSSLRSTPKKLFQITSQIKRQVEKRNDYVQAGKEQKQKPSQRILMAQAKDEDTINSADSSNQNNMNYQRQNSIENTNNKRPPLTRQLKTNMQYINQIHYLKEKNRELSNQKNQEKQTLNQLIKDNKRLLSKIDQLSEKLQKKEQTLQAEKQHRQYIQIHKPTSGIGDINLQQNIQGPEDNFKQKSTIDLHSKNLQQKLSLVQKQLFLSKQKEKTHQNSVQNLKLVYQKKIQTLMSINQHLKTQKQQQHQTIGQLNRQLAKLKEENASINISLAVQHQKINDASGIMNNLSIMQMKKQSQQKIGSLTQELMFCQKQLEQTYQTEKQFKKQIEILKRNQMISVHTSPQYAKMRQKLVKYEGMIADLQRQLTINESRETHFNNQPSYGSNGSSPFQSQYHKTKYKTDLQKNKPYENRPHYNSYQQSKIVSLTGSRKNQHQNSDDSFKNQSRQSQGARQRDSQRQSQSQKQDRRYCREDSSNLLQKVNNNYNYRQKRQKRFSHQLKKQEPEAKYEYNNNEPVKKLNKIPSREFLKKYQKLEKNQQKYHLNSQKKVQLTQPIPPVSPVSSVYYQKISHKRQTSKQRRKTNQSEIQHINQQHNKKLNNPSNFKTIKNQNQKNLSQLQRIKQNLKNVKDLHRAILEESDQPKLASKEQNQELYQQHEGNKKFYTQEAQQTYRSKQSLRSPYFSKRYTFGPEQSFRFTQKEGQNIQGFLDTSNVSNVSKSIQSENFRQSAFLLKEDVNYLVRCIGDLKLLAMKSTQLLYTRVTNHEGRFGDNPHLHIDNISNILLVCKLANKKVVGAFTQLPFTKQSNMPSYRLKNKSLLIDVTCQIVLTPTGTNLTAYGLKSNSTSPNDPHQQASNSTIIYDEKAIIWGRNQLTIKNQEPEVMYSNLGNEYGIYKVQNSNTKNTEYGFRQFLGSDEPWASIEAVQIYRIMFH